MANARSTAETPLEAASPGRFLGTRHSPTTPGMVYRILILAHKMKRRSVIVNETAFQYAISRYRHAVRRVIVALLKMKRCSRNAEILENKLKPTGGTTDACGIQNFEAAAEG
jgi:hypothetical protein